MSAPTRVDVQMYVRSLWSNYASGRQDALVARLDRLETRQVIDTYTVEVWGEYLPPTIDAATTARARELLERIDVFREWGRRNEVDLDGDFPVREVDEPLTGEIQRATCLPRVAMAEYHNGALAFVAPATADGDAITIEGRLRTLETNANVSSPYETIERAHPDANYRSVTS